MHIHDIEAFLTVVQTRNISRAAEQLYVSQTAITHRLQNLEAELGVTLLERGRGIKEISLTPSGQDFMPIAHRWAALWKELDHFKEEGEKLSLSFGSVQYLNDFIFPPLFQKLLNHQPKIHLSLHTEHTAELYPLLERREIDVAIAWRNIKYPDILCTPWKKTPLVVLKSSTTSDKGISTIDNTDLNPQDEIYVPWTPEFKNWHDDHWPSDIYSSPTLLTGAHIASIEKQRPLVNRSFGNGTVCFFAGWIHLFVFIRFSRAPDRLYYPAQKASSHHAEVSFYFFQILAGIFVEY